MTIFGHHLDGLSMLVGAALVFVGFLIRERTRR